MFWRVLFFALLAIFVSGVFLYQPLFNKGILNTKDLPPFIGAESGTPIEHLLNVWNWYFAGAALLILLLPLGFVAAVEPSKRTR